MFYTYILKSLTTERFYIGSTSSLKDRLERHNQNREKSTKGKGSWEIVYTKGFDTRSEAIKCEYYLKSIRNKTYLHKLITAWRSGSSTG